MKVNLLCTGDFHEQLKSSFVRLVSQVADLQAKDEVINCELQEGLRCAVSAPSPPVPLFDVPHLALLDNVVGVGPAEAHGAQKAENLCVVGTEME